MGLLSLFFRELFFSKNQTLTGEVVTFFFPPKETVSVIFPVTLSDFYVLSFVIFGPVQ